MPDTSPGFPHRAHGPQSNRPVSRPAVPPHTAPLPAPSSALSLCLAPGPPSNAPCPPTDTRESARTAVRIRPGADLPVDWEEWNGILRCTLLPPLPEDMSPEPCADCHVLTPTAPAIAPAP